MLSVANEGVVFQMFYNNSQNKLLCNFIRHWNETDWLVINRVFLLSLLGNWNNICQLPVNWDFSRLPRSLTNNEERSWDDTGHVFQYSRMSPIRAQSFMYISWSSKFQTSSGSAGSLPFPNAFPKFTHLFLCVVSFIFLKERGIKGLLQDTLGVKVIWDFSSPLFLSTLLLGLLFSFPLCTLLLFGQFIATR